MRSSLREEVDLWLPAGLQRSFHDLEVDPARSNQRFCWDNTARREDPSRSAAMPSSGDAGRCGVVMQIPVMDIPKTTVGSVLEVGGHLC